MLPHAVILILRLNIPPRVSRQRPQVFIISIKNIIRTHLLILADESYRRQIWRAKELQLWYFLCLLKFCYVLGLIELLLDVHVCSRLRFDEGFYFHCWVWNQRTIEIVWDLLLFFLFLLYFMLLCPVMTLLLLFYALEVV